MGNCLVMIQDRKEIKIMSVVDGGEVRKMPSPGMRSLSKFPGDLCEPALPAAAAAAAGVDDPAGAAVRVKLVISKQELKKMLDKEGMSLDDMVSLMRKEASDREQEEFCCGGWRPVLESIPEGSEISSTYVLPGIVHRSGIL